MSPTERRTLRPVAGLLAVALLAGACNSSTAEEGQADPPATAGPAGESVTLPPDYESSVFVVNVYMDEDGFEPSTIHLPAGRYVKLVLRNRGSYEHHYRVVGMVASDITWYSYPEVDEEELLATESEGGFVGDVEHLLHHLTPDFVPFREESRSGIRPLATEVHGYAYGGDHDILFFFPLETGSYRVEDVLHPEISGRVVVFDPRPHLDQEPAPEA